MKKKSFTYILLIVVAIIWFQVFARVKGSFFGEEAPEHQPIKNSMVMAPKVKDTFALNANYRDPFQDGGFTAVEEINENEIEQLMERPKPPPPVYWPKIKYYGIVRNTESTKPLAIVNVDGVQLMLRKGEEIFDGIKLSAIGRDSILVVNKREKRFFWRE